MNKKYMFSKIVEAEDRQRMIKTKAYGLVCTITLAGTLGLLGAPKVEATEIKSGLQNTPISRAALNSLSDERKAQVIEGQITDVPMSWVNDETGNLEWITGFTLVYKQKGNVVVVPVEPDAIVPPMNDKPIKPEIGVVVSKRMSKILPKTGTTVSTLLSIAGIGLVNFAGWLAFRNKKTRKTVLISLYVVGGLASSLTILAAELDFLSIVDTVSVELSSRFSHTAVTHEAWEYVGYIPIIAEEAEKETFNTGNVNIKYVDTDGNEIKELYNLVENGLVSTTTTTTTTTDGIASV
ncbi:LPXTG cell wall anchor domain-containing protein, partial [Streptococcus suis]|uniref:LPXTG cell wall anchor domain-containing protein n=3 Tax=Streptococcus suis TaxID=1307 RepID=UPI0038BC5817